jgi:two-component system OmpR family response regulator
MQGSAPKGESSVITIRGLRIEREARRVFINEREVNLAHKELDILLFLAQNPNRVFGREELFEKVWGMDALGDAATVTVHIARIRDKIEINPAQPQYVETVWGAGYRFRV